MNRCGTLVLLIVGGIAALAGCDRPAAVASASPEPGRQHSGRPADLTFDHLKFDMDKTQPFLRSMLTPQIEARFGQPIRIRGYMYPTLKRRGLTGFVLVRDNLECCFGPGAALFDCIRVEMAAGQTAEYSIRPIAVAGTLKFDQFCDLDGVTRAVYFLECATVER